MRSFVFFVGFGVVAISALFNSVGIVYYLIGINFPLNNLGTLPNMFGNPIPSMFRYSIPIYLSFAVAIGMAVLMLRRAWLIATSNTNRIPSSFSGILYTMVSISVISLCVGFLILAISILLKAGSGVPAGLLLIPAAFLLSPSIALIELLSFRTHKITPNPSFKRDA
ncbi:MAG: hypothetical protein ACAH12_10390 [Methylophilaceae bacterium]